MRTLGIWWSWFTIWNGDIIRSIDKTYLTEVYADEDILTLDELPDWLRSL